MRAEETELHWDKEGRGRAGEEVKPWTLPGEDWVYQTVTWERQSDRNQRETVNRSDFNQREEHIERLPKGRDS